jgi:hypothetical protein
MKTEVTVVFLLCIVTASRPAFTAVQRTPNDDLPQHVVALLEDDIDRTPAVRADSTLFAAGEMVVAVPFSSLQLTPSLAEHLALTSVQVRSIQRLIDQERPRMETLMQEVRTISGELRAAIQQSQNDDNAGVAQRLAAKQALLLKQLMSANSHLQRRINDVLDSRQRKKLDSFRRISEVTVGEGN